MKKAKTIILILGIVFILTSVYCNNPSPAVPADDTKPVTVTEDKSEYVPGIVKIQSYSISRPAIIFVVNHAGNGINMDVTESIIRLFAENNANLSLALLPFVGDKDTYRVKSLQYYVEAGVVDVNVDYDRLCLDSDNVSCPGMSYEELEARLAGLDEGFKEYYGEVPEACVLGKGLFCEDTYRALENSGFKVVTAAAQDDGMTSEKFTDYAGNAAVGGLVRLPFTGNVCARDAGGNGWGDVYSVEADNDLFRAVVDSLNKNWIAVIEITPEAFAAGDGEVDEGKIGKLAEIIQYSRGLGEITTYSSWYAYMDKYFYAKPFNRVKETPKYTGKPAIIFRLDDVARGWYEEPTEAIINLFKKNNVPIELGIIPYLDGKPTFDIPAVREYMNEGVADISMHGFDWTYAQIDSSKSGLTYSEMLGKMKNSRRQLKNYYNVEPVTFTVPYDFYDENGYKAVEDAGFKIFSTHSTVEPHPSAIPVDFEGKPEQNGLYRIPTATDVCTWDAVKQKWGDVYDVSQFRDLEYYPPATEYNIQQDYSSLPVYHDFSLIKRELDKLGVAAVSIHPDAFTDANGKPDEARLKKLEEIVKWADNFASVTTFNQWYKYKQSQLTTD
jgi:peptidoglycan/xylan/chitin deacetylase (PgdA/CDA1 family)